MSWVKDGPWEPHPFKLCSSIELLDLRVVSRVNHGSAGAAQADTWDQASQLHLPGETLTVPWSWQCPAVTLCVSASQCSHCSPRELDDLS